MKDKTIHMEQGRAVADVSVFDNGSEVRELHAMIHVNDVMLSFPEQLEAVTEAYNRLLAAFPAAHAVFKRYFLSDAANQADDVVAADVTDCAKSIIEQAPLDGTKIALWVWLQTNVQMGMTKGGLYEVHHGAYRHFWNASACNLAANSEYQTRLLSQMDNYAVSGISENQVHYLYAPTHLNCTSDYGVSFERGTYIDYGDRRHVFISGTASINNKGQVMFEKDVVKQTHRMWENVEALLKEADCTFDDVPLMIVYLRDPSDYAVVSRLYEERFPDKPKVIVLAPVCRTGWLVEMECMAVKEIDSEFPAF